MPLSWTLSLAIESEETTSPILFLKCVQTGFVDNLSYRREQASALTSWLQRGCLATSQLEHMWGFVLNNTIGHHMFCVCLLGGGSKPGGLAGWEINLFRCGRYFSCYLATTETLSTSWYLASTLGKGFNFPICKGLRAKKLGRFNKSSIIQRILT